MKYENANQITKKNLKDAFWKLYINKRIDQISVKEVCQLSGYNRSTFYKYFKDIYDVLESIENELLEAKIFTGNLTIMDSINKLTKAYELNKEYFAVLLGRNGDPNFQYKIKSGLKINLHRIIFAEMENSIEIDIILEYLSSSFLGVLTYVHGTDETLDFERIIRTTDFINRKGIYCAINEFSTGYNKKIY